MRKGFLRLLASLPLVSALLGGCPFQPAPSNGDSSDNGTFNGATKVALESNTADFTGTIDPASDYDLFSIGELAVGDRLVVEVTRTSGNLDPVLAIFDRDESVHAFNDDREADGRNLNSRVDMSIRGNAGEFFVGVAPFPSGGTTGGYRVQVVVTRGGGTQPEPQTVFLDYIGGENVVIPNVNTFDLEPFSATDVGLSATQTATLKRRIEAVVADRYSRYALTVLNSDEDLRPVTPHSTVYFGGTSQRAFAIAEQIDVQNVDTSDVAIIFTGSFRNAFSIGPSLAQMATAIGNTVAHEIGHLLGLVHTRDCEGLMDTTCGNNAILIEQSFKLSPLDDSVFPVGNQDAAQLLEWALGLAGM